MPIYEYRCQNDHRFEVLQKFSDEPLSVCEVCGAQAQRVLHPVAIHFKGSGFYSTDYGRGKKAGAAAERSGEAGDSGSPSSDGKGDAKKDAGSDSKSSEAPAKKAAEA